MPKADNPHAIRLYESLSRHTSEQAAQRILSKIPLSKSADANKKFKWAESVIVGLQNEFDNDTIKQIRMDCACGPEMGKITRLKKVYLASDDLQDFAEKATSLNQGYIMHCEGNALFLVYLQCYCSCVKRIDAPLSKAWCYCTLGYAKKMFEHIFDRTVEVELLESVKSGGDKCLIKIN